ncbi:hypothetical protein tloyanaT_16450 [Thalassotalea loyana]|uniref:DUF349 domain-containing protein n=1 Tax=Thalassotalea loyana TaxID=280483 RepID=A0ABQ6HB98_9GAMM|nr:DUF349 domain-containing protein [Thalassotalea loyana]GLX85393.1 hypothetical protein tloyanaT_16450 [Thalassotalea loyana]
MIFSQFFKAKWQSKDESIRLDAIKHELSVDDKKDREVLLSLVKDDSSDAVRVAALKKLQDTSVYWQHLHSTNSVVCKAAVQEIEKVFLSDFADLTFEQKHSFLSMTKKTTLIESWYAKEENTELQTALFEKLNKPNFVYTAFVNANSSELQLHIIKETSDQSLLDKCLKKTQHEAVICSIEEKLATIKLAKEKPEQIRKDTQLTLSMLLALKEQVDYETMLEKREQLEAKWHELESDFVFLSEADKDIFVNKYQHIVTQLDKAFAVKAETYHQEQIAQQLELEQQTQKEEIKQGLTQIDQFISNAIFESNTLDEAEINRACDALQNRIDTSVLSAEIKQGFTRQLSKERKKLGTIPIIAQSVSDATHLIARVAQLSVPESLEEFNEKEPIFSTWLLDWRAVEKRSAGVLPESLKSAFKQIQSQWQEALAPFEKEQGKLAQQTKKKVSDVQRLIRLGKYNAAFGVFKHAKSLHGQLNDKNKSRIARDFDQISEKIAELSDWEHYVATPRKQELLAKVQDIATSPKKDLNQQANLVKQFRQTWNSLGHAEEEQERELNDAFNDACERAFSPCRDYFAGQEKQRDDNYKQRERIVEQIVSLSKEVENIDLKALEKRFNEIKKQWQTAGEVDRKRYQVLIEAYRNACKPINNVIYQQHQSNAAIKSELIEQAKQLLGQDDIFDASQKVKGLQDKWKQVGYAGKSQENKLWQAFRKVNDEIFAKRDASKSEQQANTAQLIEQVRGNLKELTNQITNLSTLNEIDELNKQLNTLKRELPQRNRDSKAIANEINSLIATLDKKSSELSKAQQKRKWQSLFAVIRKNLNTNEALSNIEEFTELPAKWQRRLQEVEASKMTIERGDATLAVEILAGVDSPKELLEQRLAVQVKLMQKQMTSGGSIDLTEQFFDWLGQGQLREEDLPYIERIKPIYCE